MLKNFLLSGPRIYSTVLECVPDDGDVSIVVRCCLLIRPSLNSKHLEDLTVKVHNDLEDLTVKVHEFMAFFAHLAHH